MAKLIRINPNEGRDLLHSIPGVGTSARRKHSSPADTDEFFAVRLLKNPDTTADQTEYYVELSRDEAVTVVEDLQHYLGDYSND